MKRSTTPPVHICYSDYHEYLYDEKKVYLRSLGYTEWSDDFNELFPSVGGNYNSKTDCYEFRKDRFADAYEQILDLDEGACLIPIELLSSFKLQPRLKKFRARINPEKDIKLPPRGDFQIKAANRMVSQNRLMLALEMRLGKTYIVTLGHNYLTRIGRSDRFLVLSPTEGVYNFRDEMIRFSTLGLTYADFYLYDLSDREPFANGRDPKVIIMTYENFAAWGAAEYFKKNPAKKKSRGYPDYRSASIDFSKWGTNRTLVLDESQYAKNRKSGRTKALMNHIKFFENIYELSGTPAPNGPHEYYAQIKLLDPSYVPDNYQVFLNSIAETGTSFSYYNKNGNRVTGTDPEGIVEFRPDDVAEFEQRISPLVLRMFAKGNIDLKEPTEEKNYLTMSELHVKIYQMFTIWLLKESHLSPTLVKRSFISALMCLSDPSLIKHHVTIQDDPKLYKLLEKWSLKENQKWVVLKELIDQHIREEGKKMIVWSEHPDLLNLISSQKELKDLNPMVIHGQTKVIGDKAQYRRQLVNKFKNNPEVKILFTNPSVLGRAVNLKEAPIAVYWDRSYALENWLQSRKRQVDLNPEHEVILNLFMFRNSLDLRIHEVLKARKEFDEKMFFSQSLSKEEWRKIFEGGFL